MIEVDRKKRAEIEARKAAELAAERAGLDEWQQRLHGQQGKCTWRAGMLCISVYGNGYSNACIHMVLMISKLANIPVLSTVDWMILLTDATKQPSACSAT